MNGERDVNDGCGCWLVVGLPLRMVGRHLLTGVTPERMGVRGFSLAREVTPRSLPTLTNRDRDTRPPAPKLPLTSCPRPRYRDVVGKT